jgi:Zn-finger nucleic acid-binding protein
MKVPASNGNLLTGQRLPLQIDYYQKTRDIWLEKDNLKNLMEMAGSSGDHRAKG